MSPYFRLKGEPSLSCFFDDIFIEPGKRDPEERVEPHSPIGQNKQEHQKSWNKFRDLQSQSPLLLSFVNVLPLQEISARMMRHFQMSLRRRGAWPEPI